MRFWTGLFLVICLSLMTVGCAATPDRVRFLDQKSTLTGGKYVDLVWVDSERMGAKTYLPVALGPISTRPVTDQKGITAAEGAGRLKTAILEKAQEARLPLAVEGDETTAPARLELALTEMYPGGRWDRMMNAEFGAGHAFVQVEGRVVDVASGEAVLTFADRRRSSAWIGLRDIPRDAGPVVVREMLEGIAGDVVAELAENLSRK